MQENDPVWRFVHDKLQKDAESVVTLPDLRELPWEFEKYGHKPKLCDFKKDLIRVLGTDCQKDKRWMGTKVQKRICWVQSDSEAD